ncbi:MAG: DUF4364 family protein, partial [Clostridiales bacterium]|jgi:predicted transcriptional regulator|nr:DUF4364 family protein [Clostridiales bacterium]
LIILYALGAFKISMSEERLHEVLVWSGILDYFTMMNFVLELLSSGMITTVEIEGNTRYDLTRKGKELAGLFEDKIPRSVRDTIYDSAEQALDRIARGREIVADIVAVDRKKYLAVCGIYERGTPLLEVRLFAGSRQSAEDVKARFTSGAADLYKIILEKIVES